MLNHKTILIIGTIILSMVGYAYAGGGKPESLGVKQETGYRIEVMTDTLRYDPQYPRYPGQDLRYLPKYQELQFISPQGKVIKRMLYGWKDRLYITISPNEKFLIKAEETPAKWGKDSLGEWIKLREAKVKFSYINAKGEKKWHKVMDVEEIFGPPGSRDDDTWEPYFFMISRDGSRIVFVRSYRYNDYRSDIFVFDTLGNEVVSVPKIYGMESSSDLQISPDGKIVGATIYHFEVYLFFLDVETRRTKVVKAEGKGWRVSGFPLNDGKIELALHEYPKSVVLFFDEIPNDLSTLFGGEK